MNKEYKDRINRELNRYDMSLRALILGYDSWFIGTYLRSKRIVAFCATNRSIVNKIRGGVNKLIMRRIGRAMGFQFAEADIGFGVKIFHYGSIVVNSRVRIGENFCVYPGVCIGRKNDGGVPIIGNNVTFFTNSGAYGNIKIGDNVIVAPNAIVMHDVPDNCVVAGVPAKIIKYKQNNNENKG